MGASLIAGALSRNRRKKEERKRYLEAIGETFFFSTLPGTSTKVKRPFGGSPDTAPGMPGTPTKVPRNPNPDTAPGMPGDPIGTKRLPAADPFSPTPLRKPKEGGVKSASELPYAKQESKRWKELVGQEQKRELAGKLALLERLNPDGMGVEGLESEENREKYKETLEEAEDLYDLLKIIGKIDSEAEDVLEYIKGGALEIPEPELPPIEYVE